ncbi:hypothetical protein AADG42_18205 [Ammonicoccus fulvus]|uniref:Uncharacterized protein n=1 Tax=Ammonicoccus fulvus TaxID=3138240 RepID=A0ABZ3FWN4_9ACTN
MITPAMVAAVAEVVVLERDCRHPDLPWQAPGVVSAVRDLVEAGLGVVSIVAAGVAAAADESARTPIAMTWAKYRPAAAAGSGEASAADHGPRCNSCGRTQTRHDAAEAKLPVELRHPFAPERRVFRG